MARSFGLFDCAIRRSFVRRGIAVIPYVRPAARAGVPRRGRAVESRARLHDGKRSAGRDAGILFRPQTPRRPARRRDSAPDRFKITARLIGGSAVFGIGWRLVGICPGPSLLLLTGGTFQSGVFFAGVVAGFYLPNRLEDTGIRHFVGLFGGVGKSQKIRRQTYERAGQPAGHAFERTEACDRVL